MKRIGIGLGVAGILVLAAVALSLAFADDDKASPSPDDGLSLIVEATSVPGGPSGGAGVPSELPLDGIYPSPGVTPDAPIGRLPAPSPDAPVTSPPRSTPANAGSNPTQPAPTPGLPPLPPDSQRVLAPIDGADILVLESFPPQYTLRVNAGLPSGCAKPAGYEVSRSGDTVRVSVYNSVPSGSVICTAIYGMYSLNISLASDFEPGKSYTVQVNDRRLTLRAQ